MTTSTVESTARAKRLVDDFVQDLFTRGDLSAVDRYCAPDMVDHDPPFPGAPPGREGMRSAAEQCRRACPDWHSDLERLVAEDDVVVEVFTASGTHRGELLGVPPTGRTLVLKGVNVFRIEGDRIVERWGRLDFLGMARQLGLAP